MQVIAEIHYDRHQQIGCGQGMNSKVFLANDSQLGGQFAIKEIEKASLGNDVSAYFSEAQTMFSSKHPNVVPIQYACQTSDMVILAMPYFQKGSLGGRIAINPLPVNEMIRISQQLLLGLSRIHQVGFVHFDLKPSNVFFDNAGRALVADFGQARKILPDGTVSMPALYCAGVPPEVYASGTAGVAGDVYQAGLLFYRTLNGDQYYNRLHENLDSAALRQRIMTGKFPDRDFFLPHIPKRMRTVIRTALNIDLSKRYQSAHQLSACLARVPVTIDWSTCIQSDGSITWNAEREGKTGLCVELTLNAGAWDVRVWTLGTAGKRARNISEYWRSGLTRGDALTHLDFVFESFA